MIKRLYLLAAMATTFSTSTLAAAPAVSFNNVPAVSFNKLWTHAHATPGQLAEIPVFDRKTNTIWVAGVVGVDVLDADSGELIEHIDVTPYGYINSVAIHNGLAAFALEAAGDRRTPGLVLFYDTRTRALSRGINPLEVGTLPDMLTFTPDGKKLLVANEGTPNPMADMPYELPDPAGSVSIIDVSARRVIATAGFDGVATAGNNLRSNTGMDFEPEYIAVNDDATHAFVTLQEANAIGVLDLNTNAFTRVIGLGAKDFRLPGNQIDPNDDGVISFISPAVKGLYMPDSIASFDWRGKTYIAMANEGAFREDDADRSAASKFGAVAPLQRLRVSSTDSSTGNLFAAGARSFSIRDTSGNLVYD